MSNFQSFKKGVIKFIRTS